MLAGSSEAPRLDGRFRIEAELARGGMGAVFSAIEESSGRRVALKRLAPNVPTRAAVLFEREFYVLASLRHPRIIEVYDYGVDAEGPYYTMELLEGSDLREVSPVAPLVACRYLRDVASSLALLHSRRLLHRDVSPRNVRTLPDGGCKLIDFGALMSFGTSEDLVGTPPAIPPEALSGEPMDQRADLFSLGALAYYLLTGRHAYAARKVTELAEVWAEKIPPPSRYVEGVSAELDQLVLSLLGLDQLARPSSASEVIERLQVIAGLEPDHDERAVRSYFVGASLVERERELERVGRRLSRGRSTSGSSIFVEASPGVGKTRFLAEACMKAQLGGTLVLRTDAATHAGGLSTVRALMQQLVRLSPRFAATSFAKHIDALELVWPELVSQLEVERVSVERASAEPPVGFPAVLEECILSMSRKVPLLLAVDNVDRADLESVALLLALSRACRKERLVLISTATLKAGGEASPAVRALRDAGAAMRLRELTSDGVARLLVTSFGDAAHALRLAMRLFTATDGNPGHCMQLLQAFVDEGLVHYDGGAWTLPVEVPLAKLERGAVTADKLRQSSDDARRVAAIIAIRDDSVPLEWLVAFDAESGSSRRTLSALEELVQAEILVEGPRGYGFARSAHRVATLESADVATLAKLEARVGEALLTPDATATTRVAAGLHLIRGGEQSRGASLVEAAARFIIARDPEPARVLASVAPALEAALVVYRSEGRGNLSLIGLLVPLIIASYDISSTYAKQYAAETLERLERALGLRRSDRSGPVVDLAGLIVALKSAPVLDDGESKVAGAPDMVELVSALVSVVLTLVAVASIVIDHEAEERYAKALRPFTLLGPDHPAAFAHEVCRLLATLSTDHLAESHAGWTKVLVRLETVALPDQLKRRLKRATLYALGVLESQRDDPSAVARIRALEELGDTQNVAIANQLRFLYHGFRGELDLARKCRDRVEEYAVQHGSAWQVEIWSTCTASAVYANTRDATGNKRVLDQLESLKKIAPSLEYYWERTLAGHYMLNGANERAVEIYHRSLARTGPRERVGWSSVRGGCARGYNELGRHELAREICEETLALCEDDFDYVSMTLGPRIELCRALAGLGDFAGAKAKLAALLDRHLVNENPTTLGAIYRTLAEVALAEDDKEAFEAHLANMRRVVTPTRNPALIAQCDQLRNAMRAVGGWGVAQPGVGALATASQTFVQSVFASCNGEAARKQRALELAVNQAGAQDAWLFTSTGNGDALQVTSRLGITDAPDTLLDLVKELFEATDDDETEETALMQSTPFMQTTEPVNGAFRLLPLTVRRGERRILVGTIAMVVNGAVRPVSHDLLQDIASQLFAAGDVATVRTFC
ncbi:MAG TPA: protein kinase [Polyangiaceae bacterium]|jgi:tetratricopeptide (TPR) repeat protein|nr:protein kinase [Polyangiaceae bacterium]